jgi:hypothetical protein
VTERFTRTAPGLSGAARRTLRTNLRFTGRRVVPQFYPADLPLPRERAKAPYTAAEISGYLALADAQPTREYLVEAAPGANSRWRMHDLLRLYARRLSDDHANDDGREQARDRLADYYLKTAEAADKHLRWLPGIVVPEEFTGLNAALAWLDAERVSLVAAISMAAESGRNHAALFLPLALGNYFQWRQRFDEWIASAAISLGVARNLGGPPAPPRRH